MADGSVSNADEERPGLVGIGLRFLVACVGLGVGSVWILRLAFVGPSVPDGLLFELLPPLLILYLSVRYAGTQVENVRAMRRRRSEG